MLFAICLSTNTCVSVHNARELIMLSQQSSAKAKREGAKRGVSFNLLCPTISQKNSFYSCSRLCLDNE